MVALFVRSQIDHRPVNIVNINGIEIVGIELNSNKNKLYILQVYIPPKVKLK